LVGALLAADIVMSNCEVPVAGSGTDVVVGLMLRFVGSDECAKILTEPERPPWLVSVIVEMSEVP
jgi:hypothetical protein